MTTDHHPGGKHWTPMRERLLLLTLAAIQFTTVLDFIIIMPLGSQFMRVFQITPGQFSVIVSAYGIAAGITGLLAGFFLDRFDRKSALLWLYTGFTVGTFFCGLAPTYHLLVIARFATGAFGGVVGAVILAIVGDVVPGERRGSAMGLVMSSFSMASIIGVPIGLWVGDDTSFQFSLFGLSGWHLPFLGLALLSLLVLAGVALVTPPLRGHMAHHDGEHPFKRTLAVMLEPNHQKAFVFMSALTFGSFFVFPYISPYMVANVGLRDRELGWVYFCGGVSTLVSMNWIGRWSDRAGKLRVFAITSIAATIPIVALTNLPRAPLFLAVATTTLLMVCMSGRTVPAMAMMTGVVEARYRGGFMSINSAVQQLSMGMATLLSGQILGLNDKKEITGFGINGVLSLICVYSCIYLARFLKAAPKGEVAVDEVVMEPM